MKITEAMIEKVQKFGEIKIIDGEQEDIIYALDYKLDQHEFMKKANITTTVPIIVSVDDNGMAILRTYLFGEKIGNKEESVKIINELNSNFKFSKFYMDEDEDICCDATINLDTCNDEELQSSLEELVFGFLKIMIIGFKKDDEGTV